MSILPPEVGAELAQVLQALQSADNNVRSQAEDHLQNNWTTTRPEVLLMGLVEQIMGSNDTNVRTFASVIFRRIAGKTRKSPTTNENMDLFISLAPEHAAAIRQRLLEAFNGETDKGVRNKISDAVAEIARQYAENNDSWPDLLAVLFQLSIAPDAGKRETAFRVFTTTPGIIERQHEDAVTQAFARGFKDDSVPVRLAAMEAFAAFFRSLPKKNQTRYYNLLPDILSILPPIKDSQDSDNLSKALLALIELAETAPKMFKSLFNNLVAFSVSVIQDKELDDLCRQNALELMATFADYAASMCRKDSSYVNDMITQCLSLMTDLGEDDDDASEWLSADDLDQEESDLNHVAGEQAMDRLANKLGGAVILGPTFGWLPRMMQSTAWRDRHAALMAISAISEGCREQMIGELHQVLDLVVPALKDPHPRVRWAGCNALGQMSTDFAPNMQNEYYDIVLRSIIPVLASPEARVKSHAAAALVNFCEESEKTILEPYLDDLLSHLFQLLQNEKRYVQEQALSTIATIADAAEQAFSKYYDSLMPLLVSVLQRENEKEYRLLRAKAMECATLIALAVGRERLGGDAMTLVQLLANIQQSITDPDDPQANYLMHCWGRMCRVLGQEFLPFLSNVMPPLLELASAKADIQLLDDDAQVEQLQQEEGWELVALRGKTIGIRTSTMDDKNMAIELLVVYAQVLEGAFAPYVAEIMEKVAIPGLAFFFHDPVRYVSAKLIPHLLACYKKAHGPTSSELGGLWKATLPKLLEVLSAEPAIDTLAEMYQCFYESVEVIGDACMTELDMNNFMKSVTSTLQDYQERVKQRAEEKAAAGVDDAEDDAEETLVAIEDDQTLLSDMNKAFHCIFKYHKTGFLESWAILLNTYAAFLASTDEAQLQWGLCIIDDVLEYCGPPSNAIEEEKRTSDIELQKRSDYNGPKTVDFDRKTSCDYMHYITQPLITGCQHESAVIRQAAAYGVGVAAQYGGEMWAQFVANARPLLFNSTQIPSARSEKNIYATENACAAIAKILHFNRSAILTAVDGAMKEEIEIAMKGATEAEKEAAMEAAIIGQWIDTLPVTTDEEAAPYAYAFLAELIEKQHKAVTHQAANVFMLVAHALEADVLHGLIAARVVTATKMLLAATSTDPTPLLQQFPPEAQQAIRAHFV